ncbi:hypothetical protein [Mycobacterium pinniadriaticum]|uniref:Uncharacterized protein n=1 Tax=Mycobacterium pinniadriaticum TaxID=2994102 RepID=A0ABT3SG38_9MYCO|nr:hypothetical protein [Mycobacterium pinniadriaticum]MCX2938479.1 hypothetical protein [Mycobacterium pinniadriaticum]
MAAVSDDVVGCADEVVLVTAASRRANAANASASGESAGTVGRPPENGSSTSCTPEIDAAGARADALGDTEATDVTDPTVELADGVVGSALPVGSPDCTADDDPALFAAAPEESVVWAETAELVRDCAVLAFECFDPVLAPPVLTTRPELARWVRFEAAVAADAPLEPALADPDVEEFPPEELEFELVADDPVDESANATPYPVENSAAPTPSATAKPPTRPTNLEAPMTVYLPTNGDVA